MIVVKNKVSIKKMEEAGRLLSGIFSRVGDLIAPGVSTADLDAWIAAELRNSGMVSKTNGYMGYRHSSCISVNDEVVHGVPHVAKVLKSGDLVKIDVCGAWRGYCADMARCFFVSGVSDQRAGRLVEVASQALDAGVQQAVVGGRLFDISAAIQEVAEKAGFGVVRDFAGHGIGRAMHEAPEIPNYGKAGSGPVLRAGMTFAIEPMITDGDYRVKIDQDGWTVRTIDGGLAAHVEDTIVITDRGPVFLTR